MSPLFDAIENGDVGSVWKLVQDGAGLEQLDEATELTPLAVAAESGHTEIVRILLGAGADPDLGGATSPLEAAVVEGHVEVVEALIQAAADVNRAVGEGFTPLMTAATTGDPRLVRMLLVAGARPTKTNDDGETAVTIAEDAGHEAVVRLLKSARRIRAQAAQAGNGARRPRRRPAVAKKPKRTAKPATSDEPAAEKTAADEPAADEPEEPRIETALTDAVSGPVGPAASTAADSELLQLTVAPTPPKPAAASARPEPSDSTDDEVVPGPDFGAFEEALDRLKEVLAAGDAGQLQRFFDRGGIDVEGCDGSGRTALMAAAHRGEVDLVRALIEAGADVTAGDATDSGRSALVFAARSTSPQRIEILEILAGAGADLDQPCGRNRLTTLMHAAEADVRLDRDDDLGFAATTKALIKLGASLESEDRRGRTVWRRIKRDALGALTSSSTRRSLHQMLRVLEYSGAEPTDSHRV